MIQTPLGNIMEKEVQDALQHVVDNGIGNPIIMDSAPTTAGAELKEYTLGFDGSDLYIAIGGTTYKISLTAV